jgi:UDP-2-acetamido-2-deoxy-ribo-hexuluronate aminotransferase
MAQDSSPLHMVDVRGQYAHIQSEIDEAVLNVVRSGQYINGPAVRDFTSALATWLGHSEEHPLHVVPCANGTDALQAALMALDLKPGDEVITPSFTFISTVEVIHLLRLTPVMVDVDPCTFTLDAAAVAMAVSPRTKAIMPVHLYGQCADMTALQAVADEHGLSLIEDTAQAIGSAWQGTDGQWGAAGTIGTIGTTSFFPSKNLGAYGDGGACFTRDAALAERLRMICNHGSRQRYQHEIIGMNSRLDSIQAAILGVKLPHLEGYNAARSEAADRYDALLGDHPMVSVPYRHPRSRHVFHQYTIKLNNKGEGPGLRDHVAAHLQAEGVPFGIYYPKPIHQQDAFSDVPGGTPKLPVTEDLTDRVLSLPMHTELTEPQQRRVVDAVRGGLDSYI